MMNLDSIDYKILYELFLNSRQSSTAISNKINVNQSVVKYRITKLEKTGIIKHYCIVPDFQKIGYHLYLFYINLQYASPGKEIEIINYLQKRKNTWRIESSQGAYHIILTIVVQNTEELYLFYKDMLEKYSNYFKKISISQSYELQGSQPMQHKRIPSKDPKKTVPPIDWKDFEKKSLHKKILSLLNKNARIPTIDIAQQLNISVPTVISYTKHLLQEEIIKKYSVTLDDEKIGQKRFYIRFTFADYKKIDHIIQYLSSNSYIEEIYKVIGEYHLEIMLHTNTLEHFHAIMEDIRNKYANDLKDYDYCIINKIYMVPSESLIFDDENNE
jgi:Lrp/AsnC family transcriptional regulator, leucine-responsive regulatory protein